MAAYDAGIVTAYGAAVQGGYTGTYEQFCNQQAHFADYAAQAQEAAQTAETVANLSIANEYSSSSTYVVGDMCMHEGQLYECSTAISIAEEWTAAHWTAKTVADEVTDLKGGLNGKLDEPSIAGTSGQVLTSDGEGGQYWHTPSGGGGGGSVDSVNGKTGVVVLDASDVGAAGADLFVNTDESATVSSVASASDVQIPGYNIWNRTYLDGVVTFELNNSTTEKNPYAQHKGSNTFNSQKVIAGFAYRVTKTNPNATDPNNYKVRLGIGADMYEQDFPVVYDQWVHVSSSYTYTKVYMYFFMMFTNAPTTGFTLEIKEYYQVLAGGLSDSMCEYIMDQQEENYQDLDNTTFIISGDLEPDTTLALDGKAADSGAVGDALEPLRKGSFVGMNGVAFGTSLTARPLNSNPGYLTYLPTLTGITFDNQGIGSAYIINNMLAAIKSYASYSNKDVCIIEGFVNDWYYDKTLGTWKDTAETSACGCLRSAINYVFSQNANITLFIVFDHYGKNESNDNRSSTETNSASLTQYEYYEEMAKVAESLGVPVIKGYAESQISENTSQYLADSIHLNDLGAQQSANFIWSKMKTFMPNAVS